MPRKLLDIPVITVSDALVKAKRALTDAYASVETAAGKKLDAFISDNFLFPLGEMYARLLVYLETALLVAASEATPMGATGSNRDAYLELKGVTIPGPQFAQITIAVTGGNNATLSSGWNLATVSGARYTTDAAVNFGVGPETLTVNATAESIGSRSNVAVGDSVELEPWPDVGSEATVTAIIQAGADPADDEALDRLLLAAFRGDSSSGTEGWYILELMQVDGSILRIFSVPAGFGPGSIVLYPTLVLSASDQESAPWTLSIPTQGQVDAWEVEMRARATVNDRVFVEVLATPVIDIDLTISPNNADTRAAVLKAMSLRFEESYSALGYSIANSEIIGAATGAVGVLSTTINNITAGTGANSDNVPVPGASADAYALLGQVLLPNVSFT